jgi:hypothetical protein
VGQIGVSVVFKPQTHLLELLGAFARLLDERLLTWAFAPIREREHHCDSAFHDNDILHGILLFDEVE